MEIPMDYPGDDIELVSQPTSRVDPERGLFYARTGKVLELSDKPINPLILEQLQNQGKPQIPMVEVVIGGKYKQLEPNINHEGYKAQLAAWEYDRSMRLMRYYFSAGVKGEPDEAFIADIREDFPDATNREIKYLWVANQLTADDYPDLIEAIMGRSLPTGKGLEQVAQSFRGTGERAAD